VNFGVFQLYGDNALSDALDTVLQLSLSIPVQELMAYPKVPLCFLAAMYGACLL
jgi:exportin-7